MMRRLLVLGLVVGCAMSAWADSYVAHEWGTFTTLSASDGTFLTGLEWEEEELPLFVHSLADDPRLPKITQPMRFGMMSKMYAHPVRNVTVKMETPVIYFYSENTEPFEVQVNVGFNGGSISQWYPQRSAGEVLSRVGKDGKRELEVLDYAKNRQGSIQWNVAVQPKSRYANLESVKTGETPGWIRPRWPDANLLVHMPEEGSGKLPEKEKYLFYRGVGNFELPVTFAFTDGETLEMDAQQSLPYALVYENTGTHSRVIWEGAPGKGKTAIDFKKAPKMQPLPQLQPSLLASMHGALASAGLTDDEADSMLRTWWHSYFDSPGIRVFWIVPRSVVEEILPIAFSPKPSKLERVIVGRAEVLSPSFEDKLVDAFAGEEDQNPFRHSRYAQAYRERIKMLQNEEL